MLFTWQVNPCGHIRKTESRLVIMLNLMDLVKKECIDNFKGTIRVLI